MSCKEVFYAVIRENTGKTQKFFNFQIWVLEISNKGIDKVRKLMKARETIMEKLLILKQKILCNRQEYFMVLNFTYLWSHPNQWREDVEKL